MLEVTQADYVNQQLQKLNITETKIQELKDTYLPLKINGVVDKQNAKVVNAARKVVKSYRVDVEKKRKELLEDSLEYTRRINAEAKRVTALLMPIEQHLINEEEAYNRAVQEEQRKAEEAERKRQEAIIAERERIAAEQRAAIELAEKQKREEEDRIRKREQEEIRIAQAAEAARLAQIRQEQEIERRKLKEAADRIAAKEAELKAAQDEADRREALREKLANEAKRMIETGERFAVEIDLEAVTQVMKNPGLAVEIARPNEGESLTVLGIENGQIQLERKPLESIVNETDQWHNDKAKINDEIKTGYTVEICGYFKATGTFFALNKAEAKEFALEDLFEKINAERLSLDFEQTNIEVY